MALFKLQPKIYGAWQLDESTIKLMHVVNNPYQLPRDILNKENNLSKEKHPFKKEPK